MGLVLKGHCWEGKVGFSKTDYRRNLAIAECVFSIPHTGHQTPLAMQRYHHTQSNNFRGAAVRERDLRPRSEIFCNDVDGKCHPAHCNETAYDCLASCSNPHTPSLDFGRNVSQISAWNKVK